MSDVFFIFSELFFKLFIKLHVKASFDYFVFFFEAYMRKIITVFGVILLNISLMFTANEPDITGINLTNLGQVTIDGTLYYRIENITDLYWLSQNEAAWDENFCLTADIDASISKDWDIGDHDDNPATPDEAMGFLPIGVGTSITRFDSAPYTGKFNGQGYVISNLYINRPASGYGGLFGFVSSTTSTEIKNIGIENANISGKFSVGLLIGKTDDTIIENCYTTGVLTATQRRAGGLIGLIEESDCTVSNCYSEANVTGTQETGGFIGLCESQTCLISNCYATGDVIGTDEVGGFAGEIYDEAVVEKCYATGDVSGVNQVGGFAGNSDDAYCYNCFAKGDVSGEDYVGAMLGYSIGATVHYSYASGKVSGHSNVGGFTSRTIDRDEYISCFWNIDDNYSLHDSPREDVEGINGITINQMRQETTYTGWDFTHTWSFTEEMNNCFPHLVNLNTPVSKIPIFIEIGTNSVTFKATTISTNPYFEISTSHDDFSGAITITSSQECGESIGSKLRSELNIGTMYYVRYIDDAGTGNVHGFSLSSSGNSVINIGN
jgi:hypothetical protein